MVEGTTQNLKLHGATRHMGDWSCSAGDWWGSFAGRCTAAGRLFGWWRRPASLRFWLPLAPGSANFTALNPSISHPFAFDMQRTSSTPSKPNAKRKLFSIPFPLVRSWLIEWRSTVGRNPQDPPTLRPQQEKGVVGARRHAGARQVLSEALRMLRERVWGVVPGEAKTGP